MKRPKVLIADDHSMVIDGLRSLLEPEFEVVGAVNDGRAVLPEVRKLQPDVVVIDISMPLLNGLDCTRQLHDTGALRDVLQGRTYLSPGVSRDVVAIMGRMTSIHEDVWAHLTPRQREVLQLLAEGKSHKEVADILNISVKTAEYHKYAILDKLGLKTNAELVQNAVRHGIIAV